MEDNYERKVVLRGRREGKTYELVKQWLATPYAQFIVISRQEKDRIIEEYSVPENRKRDILLFDDIYNNRHKDIRSLDGCFMDNADIMLEYITGMAIKGLSMTGKIGTLDYIKARKNLK